MSDTTARKLAYQREAQEQMTTAAAKTLQEAAARVSPEVFGDTGKLTVFLMDGAVAFNDLVRVGPGPHRPMVHGERNA